MGFRFFITLMVIWGLGTIGKAWGVDASMEAAIGYDDNAAEVSDGDGSGFGEYRLRLTQLFLRETKWIDGDVFLEGSYTQYFDLDDNYRISAGGNLAFSTWRDRLRPGLFAEALAYRDDLVAEDEQDRYRVGGGLEWIADARLTLALRGSWAWADYLNAVSRPGERMVPPGMGMGFQGGRPDPPGREESFSRDDTIGMIEAGATLYPTPDIQADLWVRGGRVDSSAEFESYRENGISAWTQWMPGEAWRVFVAGSWARFDYDKSPGGTDRKDDLYTINLGIRRFIGDFEIFAQFNRTENDSPVDGEGFVKTVTQCGVAYSF